MDNMAISLGKRQLVDSIWKSTGIEGLGTTFPSTEAILDNLPVTTTRDEVYFVCNMKRAWEFLFDNMEYPNNLMLLRQLNKIAMENLIGYGAGQIRTVPVTIGGTSWVPAMPHEGVIIEKLDDLARMEDKLDSALETFCYLARTQMFIDGNKRMAQLLANKILMENDIGILSIPYEKIDQFKELLISFYETGDNTTLKDFLKQDCLLITNEKYKEQLEEKNEHDDLDL